MPNENILTKLKIPYKPVVLLVLDGFGVNPSLAESTWSYAKRPTMEELEKYYPFTTLQASGVSVGLMWGEAGNSEVGHLTMGSGRVVYHHLPRIIVSIQEGDFFKNTAFLKAINHVRENQSSLHIMGLFSSGSVHAYADHLYALLDLAKQENVQRVFLHLFTDGRDAPPKESVNFFGFLQERIKKEYPFAKIASIIGRRLAMDRDDYWDRVEKTYRLLVDGFGEPFDDPIVYLAKQHDIGNTDEFIEPAFLRGEKGRPIGRFRNNDALIFFNYREDSMRELTASLTVDGFDKFAREKLNNFVFVTMTQYDEKFLGVDVAFPPLELQYPLARVLSDAGKKQLHVGETEKYAHVTYFFNGGIEKPFPNEDRKLIPSPKNVRYDDVPEMSASAVARTVIEDLENYDFILANFANGDMVGHTGNFEATVKAIEALDFSIGEIIPKTLEKGGVVIITSDHGNAEEKIYATSGEKRTKHTINPVPFFIIAKELRRVTPITVAEIKKAYSHTEGVLTDVAPTILELMKLEKSKEMTGISLLSRLAQN